MKNIWFIVILVVFAVAGFVGNAMHPGNYIWVFSVFCIAAAIAIVIFGNKGIQPPTV